MKGPLGSILSGLEQALVDERTALVRLDTSGIESATSKKAALADRLAALLDAAEKRSPSERAKLLRALTAVRWSAEANRALLSDAGDLLSSVRAMPVSSGTYSRRACIGKAAPDLDRYGT